jgi:AraC-like DNA-binding protein
MNNPWNVQMQDLDFDEDFKTKILEYYNSIVNESVNNRKEILKNRPLDSEVLDYLKHKYIDEEYGYKTLSRCLDLSYTRVRTLLKDYLKIEVRKGLNVTTERVRKFRSDRIKGDKNPWAYELSRSDKVFISLQGYFIKKNGEKIWLRSSWEYIYAKWLESNNINFKTEEHRYKLSNGKMYFPDFFIYDDNNELLYIVEIKGYQDSRMYKLELFRNEYPDIKLIIITDIMSYCSNYKGEVEKWRQDRLSKELK